MRIYCDDVRLALKVLRGLGNAAAADAALVWAIALVEPSQARTAVCSNLLLL